MSGTFVTRLLIAAALLVAMVPSALPTAAQARSSDDDDSGKKAERRAYAKKVREAAEDGDVKAQTQLGIMHAIGGEGVRHSYKDALKWLQAAADKGDAHAIYWLGNLYSAGKGVDQDDAEAFKLYRQAAQKGDVGAMNGLGLAYRDGGGVPKDAKTAVIWFQKAAEQNYAPGQFNLAVARLTGEGIAQDDKDGARLMLASANQGYGPGMYVLAEVLRKNHDPQQALVWALLAEAREIKGADTLVEKLSSDLSASQRNEAKSQAAAWRPKKAGEDAAPDLRQAGDDEGGSTKSKPATTTGGGGDRLVATGTGFFVSSAGHIVTNHHVIDGCSRLDAGTNGSGKFPAQVVGDDAGNDLAVLKIATSPKSVASFRSGQIRQAEGVMAYGFPLTGALSSEGNATSGTITALTGLRDDIRFYQMSAPVQPGNSGGPLLDMGGNVVGVVVAKMDALRVAKVSGDIPQNVNFAIKSSVATTFLESHGVQFATNSLGSEKSNPDISEQAKGFSVLVGCYK